MVLRSTPSVHTAKYKGCVQLLHAHTHKIVFLSPQGNKPKNPACVSSLLYTGAHFYAHIYIIRQIYILYIKYKRQGYIVFNQRESGWQGASLFRDKLFGLELVRPQWSGTCTVGGGGKGLLPRCDASLVTLHLSLDGFSCYPTRLPLRISTAAAELSHLYGNTIYTPNTCRLCVCVCVCATPAAAEGKGAAHTPCIYGAKATRQQIRNTGDRELLAEANRFPVNSHWLIPRTLSLYSCCYI